MEGIGRVGVTIQMTLVSRRRTSESVLFPDFTLVKYDTLLWLVAMVITKYVTAKYHAKR